jgi:hypothetical protein
MLGGRSIYIHQLASVIQKSGGVDGVVVQAEKARIGSLWIKIADGATAFANTKGNTGDALRALSASCAEKGVSVLGYHVPHCKDAAAVDAEIALLTGLVADFALAGVVVDNEDGPAYFRGDADTAEAYGAQLAAEMQARGKLVVMSSNDIVSWHPKAYASVIGAHVNVNAPQVYYGASASVKDRLNWAREQNSVIAAPFFPVGVCVVEPHGEDEGAFSDAAKCAAAAVQFIILCSALHATNPNKYPGYGFWDWDQAPQEFWDVLNDTEVFPGAAATLAAPVRKAIARAAAVEADPFAPIAFDPKTAVAYGQFVAAAYSMYNADRSDLTPRPSADFPAGYALTGWVQMKDFVVFETGPTFYGFIAQSKQNPGQFVLALRGTQTPEEWWDDFVSLLKVPFSIPGCGSVPAGFDRIYQTLEIVAAPTGGATASAAPVSLAAAGGFSHQVAALVARASVARALAVGGGAPSLVVVGHSLGSALATLYTLENAHENRVRHPLLCTFASPRVGDGDFVRAFEALPLTSWRIVNKPDVVPMLPPEIAGFQHVTQEIDYDSSSTVRANIGCWHALATYISLLDKARPPDPACRLATATVLAPAHDAGLALAAPAGGGSDAAALAGLLARASDPAWLRAAEAEAARRLLTSVGEQYPSDGCAITLSVLLQQSGIAVPDTFAAFALGRMLEQRGWRRIAIGQQQAGDVGSTCGAAPHHGTDHIYLVLKAVNADEMVVADNQAPTPHFRRASGGGKSPTTFFLRAPDAAAPQDAGAAPPAAPFDDVFLPPPIGA